MNLKLIGPNMTTSLTQNERPVIATDVDGVLLSWQSGLPYFAQKYNLPLEHILEMIQDDKFIKPGKLFGCDEHLGEQLINKYNSSDFIRYLAPYMDALRNINKLKKAYDFVAVTALGDSIDARLNRQFNLNALFPGAFQDIQMCAHNESKEIILTKVRLKYGSRVKFFVDDLPHHCQAAKRILDVPVYWMVRGERDGFADDCTKVTDWDDIVAIETRSQNLSKNLEIIQTEIDRQIGSHKDWQTGLPPFDRIKNRPESYRNIKPNDLRAYYGETK